MVSWRIYIIKELLHKCKNSVNFWELLDLYSQDGAKALEKVRKEQLKRGGII